jgi:hypothetical protein
MEKLNSQELFLAYVVTLFALIGLAYVISRAIRWLRAWKPGPLGFVLLMYGIIALMVAAAAFLGPPFIYYFVNYVGSPVGIALKQWWRYWGF